MTGLLVAATTSLGRFGGPLTFLVAGLVALQNRVWIGSWSWTLQAATNTLPFILPFACFAAAWDSGQLRRQSNVVSLSRRSLAPVRNLLARWSGVTVWFVGAHLLTFAGLGFITARRSPVVSISVLPLLSSILTVCAVTALGTVIGRFFPVLATLPVAVIIGWALPAALSETGRRPSLFTVVENGAIGVGYQVRPTVAAAQTVLFAGVTVLLVAVAAVATLRTRKAAALVVSVALLTSVPGAVLAVVRPDRTEQVADRPGPRVCSHLTGTCLWRDHAYYQPVLNTLIPQAFADLPGGVPTFTESGLTRHGGDLELWLPGNNLSPVELAELLAQTYLHNRACPHGGLPGPDDRASALIEVLAFRALNAQPTGATSATARQVLRQPRASERQAIETLISSLHCER